MKQCPKCARVLPTTEFGRNIGTRDNLTSQCRECRNRRQAEMVVAKGGRPRGPRIKRTPGLAAKRLRECSKCWQVLPYASFSAHAGKPEGLALWCKPCRSQWVKDNAQFNRAAAQKRHARLHSVDTGLVTQAVIDALYAETRCAYCTQVVPTSARTIDHVTPVSRGGLHHPDNLVMACPSC